MLESEILKSQDNNGRENKEIDNFHNLESKRDVITGNASDKKFVYLKHQVESPGTFYTVIPHGRKNFRHQINRSLNFGINPSRRGNLSRLSPNSSMDHSRSSINKSSRNLSRSAQMMRALSKNHASFRYANESIKKTLTFDSSPSPRKTNSSEESTSVDSIVNTPLHTPDKSLEHDRNSTDSASTSSVPTESFESIDENQNRTPQQNRIVSKMIGSSDTKRSSDKSGSPGSTSMLRSNLRKRIDSITRNARTHELQCFNRDDRLRASSCDIAASTPRNLYKEFSEDEEGSPHTPENLRFIPENMSSIKKSHKKERSHSLGGKAWQVNDPIKSKSLCVKRPMEFLEADDVPSNSSCKITVKDSPKKIRNVKKTLIYDLDDELSDKESISNHVEQGVAPKNIDSSDCEMCEENIQDIDDILPSTSSTSNDKENDSYLQKASSSNANLAEYENKEISLESNSAVSGTSMHDCLMHYLSSIPNSVMWKFDKNCYELQDDVSCQMWKKRFEVVTAEPIRNVRMSDVQNTTEKINRTQNNDMIHPKNERPITPENLNSSRLLLSQFTSVKKSHKEDKRKYKSLFGIPICDVEDKETFRKVVNLLADDLLTEVNSDKSRNMSFPIRLSLDKSKKKKRFMSRSLQSNKHDDLPQLAEPLPTEYKNMGDKSNTCIRNRVSSILLSLKNHIRRSETSSGELSDNEPVKVADATDENEGRLTPTNMSTAELLCNKDSIKKSHKKDKHDASLCKRRIPRKNLSEDSKEIADMNFADCTKLLENHTTASLKLDLNDDSLCDEIGACSSMRNEDNKKSNENNIYDPQPSTSRGIIESKEDTKKLKPLSTTPPNSLNTLKFMRLLHTTSIKKSHKKERHLKKQSKYILMNKEYDLSDDGSIFDEDDILTSGESSSLFQNNKN